jgi:hypothetical protein
MMSNFEQGEDEEAYPKRRVMHGGRSNRCEQGRLLGPVPWPRAALHRLGCQWCLQRSGVIYALICHRACCQR